MIDSVMIKYANALEMHARKIKKSIEEKRKKIFFKKYDFIDMKGKNKKDVRFNSYEGTSLGLIKSLINSGVISKNEKIIDIGCGTGMFIVYMANHGFTDLTGIEYDWELFHICKKNIDSYRNHGGLSEKIEITYANALEMEYDDDITCYYLFNTFYDKDTYVEWMRKVEDSLIKRPIKIKIIILFPTVASMGAMREFTWLNEKERIISKEQRCYNCMHFIVYEGGDTFENITDFNNK